MITLSIKITEKQYTKYGLSKEQFDFDEFVKMLKKDIAKEALKRSRTIARKSPLVELTMEDINAEIEAVRSERKQRRHAQAGS